MTYIGSDNREYEDPERDNMRRDAIEQERQNALIVPTVKTDSPCEDCGKAPALQWTVAGIASGVLCRSCLNAVIAEINSILAMAHEGSEQGTETYSAAPYSEDETVHLKDTPFNARICAIIPNFEGSEQVGYSLIMSEEARNVGYNAIEHVSEQLIEPVQIDSEQEKHLADIADSIVRLGGKEPCKFPECERAGTYQCFECSRFFCFGHIIHSGNVTYCFEHAPDYDKHQQF